MLQQIKLCLRLKWKRNEDGIELEAQWWQITEHHLWTSGKICTFRPGETGIREGQKLGKFCGDSSRPVGPAPWQMCSEVWGNSTIACTEQSILLAQGEMAFVRWGAGEKGALVSDLRAERDLWALTFVTSNSGCKSVCHLGNFREFLLTVVACSPQVLLRITKESLSRIWAGGQIEADGSDGQQRKALFKWMMVSLTSSRGGNSEGRGGAGREMHKGTPTRHAWEGTWKTQISCIRQGIKLMGTWEQ